MKILLLCWRDTTHPQGGGSERYLEHVARYLSDRGHEVIYRTAAHTDCRRKSVRDGITFYRGGVPARSNHDAVGSVRYRFVERR